MDWTDRKTLAYLHSAKRLDSQEVHWLLFLGLFQLHPDPPPLLREHQACCPVLTILPPLYARTHTRTPTHTRTHAQAHAHTLPLLSLPPQHFLLWPCPGPCSTEVMESFQSPFFLSPLLPPLPCASALLLPSPYPEWQSFSCQCRFQFLLLRLSGLWSLGTATSL